MLLVESLFLWLLCGFNSFIFSHLLGEDSHFDQYFKWVGSTTTQTLSTDGKGSTISLDHQVYDWTINRYIIQKKHLAIWRWTAWLDMMMQFLRNSVFFLNEFQKTSKPWNKTSKMFHDASGDPKTYKRVIVWRRYASPNSRKFKLIYIYICLYTINIYIHIFVAALGYTYTHVFLFYST